MIGENHGLTPGWVQRHVPPSSRLDVRIAVLDIAQDFLIAHLDKEGIFDDLVVFKGGTALRKLFAGAAGRFSTDIDLAARAPDVDRGAAAHLIAEASQVTLGPFTYTPSQGRGRWQIAVTSPFGTPEQSIKLDVGPPCWLAPERRPFVPHVTHPKYGFTLPSLPCMRFEEILAEKIARLARIATARDASDLVWAAKTSPHSQYDRALVRRLSVLKVWVDRQGMVPGWQAAIAGGCFDPDAWLARRETWDDEQIGLLTHPTPPIRVLEAELFHYHQWLRELQPDEVPWAAADARHRREVIAAILALPACALDGSMLR
jgi:predicted nucleotidyltransferase component of viral defense system